MRRATVTSSSWFATLTLCVVALVIGPGCDTGPRELSGPIAVVEGTPPTHGILGVSYTQDSSQPLLVRGALAGSPAEAAGITAGDKLVSLNGTPVSTRADVKEQLAGTRPGDTIQVGLQRAGSSVTCDVQLLSFEEAVVLRTRLTTEGATQ